MEKKTGTTRGRPGRREPLEGGVLTVILTRSSFWAWVSIACCMRRCLPMMLTSAPNRDPTARTWARLSARHLCSSLLSLI